MDVVDLNHGSGFVYGFGAREVSVAQRVNTLIDAALLAARRVQPERDYLGASRLGEPCGRRLAYEITHTPPGPEHHTLPRASTLRPSRASASGADVMSKNFRPFSSVPSRRTS